MCRDGLRHTVGLFVRSSCVLAALPLYNYSHKCPLHFYSGVQLVSITLARCSSPIQITHTKVPPPHLFIIHIRTQVSDVLGDILHGIDLLPLPSLVEQTAALVRTKGALCRCLVCGRLNKVHTTHSLAIYGAFLEHSLPHTLPISSTVRQL